MTVTTRVQCFTLDRNVNTRLCTFLAEHEVLSVSKTPSVSGWVFSLATQEYTFAVTTAQYGYLTHFLPLPRAQSVPSVTAGGLVSTGAKRTVSAKTGEQFWLPYTTLEED